MQKRSKGRQGVKKKEEDRPVWRRSKFGIREDKWENGKKVTWLFEMQTLAESQPARWVRQEKARTVTFLFQEQLREFPRQTLDRRHKFLESAIFWRDIQKFSSRESRPSPLSSDYYHPSTGIWWKVSYVKNGNMVSSLRHFYDQTQRVAVS